MDSETREAFDTVNARFEAVDAKFEAIDARFEAVDARFDAVDARFDAVDARFDRMMAGIAQEFQNQRAYMDMRFEQILEAMDFRHGSHERRIRRLEEKVFGSH